MCNHREKKKCSFSEIFVTAFSKFSINSRKLVKCIFYILHSDEKAYGLNSFTWKSFTHGKISKVRITEITFQRKYELKHEMKGK